MAGCIGRAPGAALHEDQREADGQAHRKYKDEQFEWADAANEGNADPGSFFGRLVRLDIRRRAGGEAGVAGHLPEHQGQRASDDEGDGESCNQIERPGERLPAAGKSADVDRAVHCYRLARAG